MQHEWLIDRLDTPSADEAQTLLLKLRACVLPEGQCHPASTAPDWWPVAAPDLDSLSAKLQQYADGADCLSDLHGLNYFGSSFAQVARFSLLCV